MRGIKRRSKAPLNQLRRRGRADESVSESAEVITIESDESDLEGGGARAPQAPATSLLFDPPADAGDDDQPGLINDSDDDPAGLINDSDSNEDVLSLTSDSDCGEDCWKPDEANPVDFSAINRTADGHGSASQRQQRPTLEATSVRPSIAPSRELLDPTTPDIGMTDEEMQTFLKFSPPRHLLLILAIMFASPCYSNNVCLDFVEYFSGQQAVTNGFDSLGLFALPYDVINDGRYQDLNSTWGFIHALQLLRMLEPLTGLMWLGTVCSTWVFMSRNSTMRTVRNPRGDLRRRCVLKGNKQAARSAALIAFCFARRMGFVLEQPGSSILWLHPAIAHVERVARCAVGGRWHRVCTYMHHFAGSHIKRTELCSNESWIHHLSRPHPGRVHSAQPAATTRRRKADGKLQCSGTAHLKATQTYTREFGDQVAGSVMNFRKFFDDVGCERGQTEFGDSDSDSDDPWEDVQLGDILRSLQAMHPHI